MRHLTRGHSQNFAFHGFDLNNLSSDLTCSTHRRDYLGSHQRNLILTLTNRTTTLMAHATLPSSFLEM